MSSEPLRSGRLAGTGPAAVAGKAAFPLRRRFFLLHAVPEKAGELRSAALQSPKAPYVSVDPLKEKAFHQ